MGGAEYGAYAGAVIGLLENKHKNHINDMKIQHTKVMLMVKR